jgi:hypothetical protein
MYREILLTITGIHIFPVISLVLFVIVFSSVLVSVARMDSRRAEHLAALPLDGLPDKENVR